MSAHNRKNLHGIRSYKKKKKRPLFTDHNPQPQRKKLNLEPNDDEVPEPNHADLRGASPNPRFPVFDGDDVHEVEDELHRHEGDDEAEEVLHCCLG